LEVIVKDLEDNLLKKLKEDPLDYLTLNKIGYIYLHSDNLLKSEEVYLKSVNINPQQFEPYVSLGLIYTIKMNLGKSLYFLLKAKLFNPEAQELLKSIEEINLAIKNKYSSLSQEEINNLFNESLSLIEKDFNMQAIEKLLILFVLAPENDLIIEALSSALIKNNEYELALLILDDIINKYNNPFAYYYTGVSYNFLSQPEKAKFYINKSIEIKPSLLNPLLSNKASIRKEYDEEKLNECPICKSNKIELYKVFNQSFLSVNYNIINPIRLWFLCKDCDLVFANPRPTKNISYNYSVELFLDNRNKYNLDKLMLENNAFNERLNNISKFKNKGKLLDIFSDTGIFIGVSLDKGWEVFSVEENHLKAKFIGDLYPQINIRNNINDFSKEKFDVVTLWENIERIADLESYMVITSKILKKKGIFAISFHNRDSYISKIISNNEPVWSYPDYLYIYNKKNLVDLFEKYDLKLIDCQVIWRKYIANTELYFIKE
jgi:tetratricopeptide (TPR) repeat protein